MYIHVRDWILHVDRNLRHLENMTSHNSVGRKPAVRHAFQAHSPSGNTDFKLLMIFYLKRGRPIFLVLVEYQRSPISKKRYIPHYNWDIRNTHLLVQNHRQDPNLLSSPTHIPPR